MSNRYCRLSQTGRKALAKTSLEWKKMRLPLRRYFAQKEACSSSLLIFYLGLIPRVDDHTVSVTVTTSMKLALNLIYYFFLNSNHTFQAKWFKQRTSQKQVTWSSFPSPPMRIESSDQHNKKQVKLLAKLKNFNSIYFHVFLILRKSLNFFLPWIARIHLLSYSHIYKCVYSGGLPQFLEWNIKMSDMDMSDNDDEYQMEYTSESDSEPDVDLENQVS